MTPSYNQGRFLEQTIRSVLLQGYPNLEYLVVDGGSTDETSRVIDHYRSNLSWAVSEKDGGQAEAIRKGFSRATGDILAWVNSDDILLPGALLTIGLAARANPDSGFFFGNRFVIDEAGREIRRTHPPTWIPAQSWSLGMQLAQEACFWRTGLYRDVGGIRTDFYFILDYDLFYRMQARTKFFKVHRYLGAIREHRDTKSARHHEIMNREFRAVKNEYGVRELRPFERRATMFACKQLSRIERMLAWADRTVL